MSFAEDQLTCDGFLGGRLRLWQPKTGYRAATDPVLLAAFATAGPGDRVLDLGCGAGAAVLCLMRRVQGLQATGLELQPDYAGLAARNAAENGLELEVVAGDVADMPASLRAREFDLVICNPPYFCDAAHTAADDAGRDLAQRGAGVAGWLDAGLRRLRPSGQMVMIQRAEYLADMLAGLSGRAGDIRIVPVQARHGRPAGRVLVSGQKGARGPLALLPPLVMHHGAEHQADGDDYSARASGILRDMLPV